MSPGTTSDEGAAPDHGPAPGGAVLDPSATPGGTTPGGGAASGSSVTSGGGAVLFAERRRRLQTLAGLTVRGSDGRTVGRVRDIYPLDAGTELAAITVMPRQLSAHAVLIPVAAIASLPEPPGDAAAAGTGRAPAVTGTDRADDAPTPAASGPAPADADSSQEPPDTAIHLLVDAATAKAGAHPPPTLHATPQDLQAAATALGLGEGSVTV